MRKLCAVRPAGQVFLRKGGRESHGHVAHGAQRHHLAAAQRPFEVVTQPSTGPNAATPG